MGDQEAVGVLVFAGNLVAREKIHQFTDKVHHLFVPRDVGHGEAAGRAFPAVRHPLGKRHECISGRQPQTLSKYWMPISKIFGMPCNIDIWIGTNDNIYKKLKLKDHRILISLKAAVVRLPQTKMRNPKAQQALRYAPGVWGG